MPLRRDFKEQFNKYVDAFVNALKIRKLPYIRSCEPRGWWLDGNCYGLSGYLQQTIYRPKSTLNEESKNLRGIHAFVKLYESNPEKLLYIFPLNTHAECDGELFNCWRLSTFLRGTITCAWENGPYKIRVIRDGGEIFGTDKQAMELLNERDQMRCHPKNFFERSWNGFDVDSPIRCQCSESRMKILRRMIDSMSDINYVIVGLQIHKVRDYIYIRIAEGKLEANGYISDYSWVSSTRVPKHLRTIPFVFDRVKRDEDAFFMGDVQLPPGHALTSIGFVQREVNGVHGTAIQIGGCKFNYGTGEVDPSQKSELLVEHGTDHELKFPTKTPIDKTEYKEASPKSDEYTHVHLQRSDLSDDYGQTTLPLLDGVPVMTKSLSPIGGVGFFYKAFGEDYAGFLSLRLYPLNYAYFIDIFKRSNDVNLLLNSTN